MVERADLVAELVGDVDHLRHLVGAVAVVVHEYVAAQNFGEGLESEVARRRIALVVGVPFVPLATIIHRSDPGAPVTGDVAHARGRSAALTINSLRIFTARHLQSVLRARKFHRLHRAAGYNFEDDAATADQICGAGKHLQSSDATGQVARELRILGPHRMLGPDLWCRRIRCLVAVAECIAAGSCIHTKVRVIVDDTRCDVFAGAVDLTVLQQDGAVPDHRAGGSEEIDVSYYRRPRREWNVGAGKRVSVGRRGGAASDVRLR